MPRGPLPLTPSAGSRGNATVDRYQLRAWGHGAAQRPAIWQRKKTWEAMQRIPSKLSTQSAIRKSHKAVAAAAVVAMSASSLVWTAFKDSGQVSTTNQGALKLAAHYDELRKIGLTEF